MFTQTRTNLKLIGTILFVITFLIGGFFVKTTNAEATDTARSFNISYSLSPVTSSPNNDGGLTTTVLIGCAPQSGDIYDINTGKPCVHITKTVLIGCAVESGDLYDINTGKRCINDTTPVLIGCAPKSGDLYDINTGKRCINDTSIVINKSIPTKTVAKIIPKITTTKTTVTKKALELATVPNDSIEILPTKDTEKQLSGREMIGNSLDASVKKVGSIINSPMSIPLILLIIVILLGGGYAVYSLFKKDLPTHVGQAGKKEEVKKIITEPIIQHKPITPVTPPITQQFKTSNQQGSLLNNSENPNPTKPQEPPLNIPHNSNPNPQEPF